MKKIYGKILYYIGKFFEKFFTLFINVFEFISRFVKELGFTIIGFLGFGLVLVLLLLISNPLTWIILPFVLPVVLFFVLIPVVSDKLANLNLYWRYKFTEYFSEKSAYYIDGRKMRYGSFKEYGDEYKRKEEEKAREDARQREEAYRRQQEEARKTAEDFFRQATGGFSWYDFNTGQGYNAGNQGGYFPGNFRETYEKYCDILEVPYDADENLIKRSYRSQAKKYHPDINKAPDAKEKFQKVNEAREFLNEDNIRKYNQVR